MVQGCISKKQKQNTKTKDKSCKFVPYFIFCFLFIFYFCFLFFVSFQLVDHGGKQGRLMATRTQQQKKRIRMMNNDKKNSIMTTGWSGISHWKQLRRINVFGKDSISMFENEVFNGHIKNILVLGDVDFSLSLSIFEKCGQKWRNNYNCNNSDCVIATSHLKDNWRFDSTWCFKRMKHNQGKLLRDNKSMVLHDINPVRQSLKKQLKCVSIDKVIYRLDMTEIENEERMKCVFEKFGIYALFSVSVFVFVVLMFHVFFVFLDFCFVHCCCYFVFFNTKY